MAEEREKFANDPDQDDDVEGHGLSPDDDNFDSSDEDEDDEVEAHKF